MAVICTNCKKKLGCGCQQRVASDGTKVCTLCITAYEAVVMSKRNASNTGRYTPVLNAIVYNPPGFSKE